MTPDTPQSPPRLLNLRQAAAYCGLSFWTLRDYVLQGHIPVVDLPPLRPREGERPRLTLRRVLVDRLDLDWFINSRKTGDVQSRAPQNEAAKPGQSAPPVTTLYPRGGRR
jgi:hypothetical protein